MSILVSLSQTKCFNLAVITFVVFLVMIRVPPTPIDAKREGNSFGTSSKEKLIFMWLRVLLESGSSYKVPS